jgi:Tfp pilus assembly protein PilE
MKQIKAGFSLLELVLIAVFLGVFAVIAVPRLNYDVISKHKAGSTARKLVTDLRLTRSLAINDAANNSEGYKLLMFGSAPYSRYRIVNNDTGEIIRTYTIDSKVSCTGGNIFMFAPLGNLLPPGDNHIMVSAEGKSFTITIIPATGIVKCTEN